MIWRKTKEFDQISDSNKGKVRNEHTRMLMRINASKRNRNNRGQFDYEEF